MRLTKAHASFIPKERILPRLSVTQSDRAGFCQIAHKRTTSMISASTRHASSVVFKIKPFFIFLLLLFETGIKIHVRATVPMRCAQQVPLWLEHV